MFVKLYRSRGLSIESTPDGQKKPQEIQQKTGVQMTRTCSVRVQEHGFHRRVHTPIGIFIVFFFAMIMLLPPALYAEKQFYVVEKKGTLRVVDGERGSYIPNPGAALSRGSVTRTYRQSECVVSDGNVFYKLYPFSKARFTSSPQVVYGKMSRSGSTSFVDLHFYISGRPVQGHTIKIVVRTSERNPSITAYIRGSGLRQLSLFPVGRETYRALAGFDIESAADRYELEIRAKNSGGDDTQIVYPFYLGKTLVERGRVQLPSGKGALFEPSAQKEREREYLSGVLARMSQTALWEGTFDSPVRKPVVISKFGKRRGYYLNGRFFGFRYHRGIDFRADRGQNVYAPNRGYVVFAKQRITTGNTVVIDHGQGVYSLIFHLDSISVPEGMLIEKGEKIGEAGATGLAAGVHVHWSVVVDGVYVDPEDWQKIVF